MSAQAWQVTGTVIALLITAVISPTVLQWLRGAQKSEADDMAQFRKDQRQDYLNLRAEHATLLDAYRELERRHDDIEQTVLALKNQLANLDGEVTKARSERDAALAVATTLREERNALIAEIAAEKWKKEHP